MIQLPLMSAGEKLEQARLEHFTKMSRPAVAEALSAYSKEDITSEIIKNIEDGRSTKWLDIYIDWAATTWGVDPNWVKDPVPSSTEFKQVVAETSQTYSDQRGQMLQVWKGEPNEQTHEIEFRPTKDFMLSPLNLEGSSKDYIALRVAGFWLSGIAKTGSTIIIRLDDIPHHNTISLIEGNGYGLIRGFIAGQDRYELHRFHFKDTAAPEIKTSSQNFVGYAVAIIEPYDPHFPLSSNVKYSGGQPLLFRSTPI